jgi:hypothetical protein
MLSPLLFSTPSDVTVDRRRHDTGKIGFGSEYCPLSASNIAAVRRLNLE